jgi:hypothetical protein
MWQKRKAAMSKCEASRNKFSGPKKGQFLEIDDAVLMFLQKRQKWNKLFSFVLTA